MSERDSPSREFLQFPAEGNSSIRLLYVGESPELLGSWSTTIRGLIMKKLLIMIIILACMGCSECVTNTASDGDGYLPCEQPPGESCGFLKEWDFCECECDWVF